MAVAILDALGSVEDNNTCPVVPSAGSDRYWIIGATRDGALTANATIVVSGTTDTTFDLIASVTAGTEDVAIYGCKDADFGTNPSTANGDLNTIATGSAACRVFSVVFSGVDQTTPFTNTEDVGWSVDNSESGQECPFTLDEVADGYGVVAAGCSRTGADTDWLLAGSYVHGAASPYEDSAESSVYATKAITSTVSTVLTTFDSQAASQKVGVVAVMLLPATSGDKTIAVPVGSIVLAGKIASILQPVLISVPVGSLTLSSDAPEVVAPVAVDVPKLSLVLSGKIPTLDHTAHHIRAPPTASLALAADAPTILQPVTVSVPSGTLTLDGKQPQVVAPVVTDVPVGSLTLSGQSLTVLQPVAIDTPVGSLTLSGKVPVVLSDQTVEPPVGSLSLSGQGVTVLQPVTTEPGTLNLSLSGKVPTVLQPVTISVPSGSLSLSGQSLTVLQPVTVSPGTLGLSLSGQIPVVAVSDNQDNTPLPGTLALSLSGKVPVVVVSDDQDSVPAPGTLSLTLAGQVPVVLQPAVINTPVGSLSLSGQTPVVCINNPEITSVNADAAWTDGDTDLEIVGINLI